MYKFASFKVYDAFSSHWDILDLLDRSVAKKKMMAMEDCVQRARLFRTPLHIIWQFFGRRK